MKEMTASQAESFRKDNPVAGKPRTTLRKVIDAMEVGKIMLFTQKDDFPKKNYRHVYYMLKDAERKEDKLFRCTNNKLKTEVLVERIK